MKSEKGFTVVELVIFFVVLVVLGAFFWLQKADLEASMADQARKVAINSMYYSLTEVYYKNNGFYPSQIDSDVLTTVDPDLFIDPFGLALGEENSDYYYEGIDCSGDDHCKDFRLSSDMEKEAEYVRTGSEK